MKQELLLVVALVGVFTALAFITWFAFLLGFRGRRAIASEADVQRLSAPFGGAQQVFIEDGGGSAIALLRDDRVLAAKAMGNDIATRVFARSAVESVSLRRSSCAPSRHVLIRFKDFSFPALKLNLTMDGPPDWLFRLTPGA